MAAFASGLLGALNQRSHEQNLLDLQGEISRRQELASTLNKLITHPEVRPEARDEYMRQLSVLQNTPYTTKLPKDVGNLSIKVPLTPGGSLNKPPAPSTPQAPNLPPVNTSSVAGDVTSPNPVNAVPPQAIPIPPPPQINAAPFFSPEEIGQRKEVEAAPLAEGNAKRSLAERVAEYKAQQEIEKQKLADFNKMSPEEKRAYQEMHGKVPPRPIASQKGVLGSALIKSNPDIKTHAGDELDPNTSYDVMSNGYDTYASPSAAKPEPTDKVWIQDKGSKTGWTLRVQTKSGKVLSETKDVLDHPQVGRISTHEAIVEQADGTKRVVPLTSVSTPSIGGGSSFGGGSTPKAVNSAPPINQPGRTVGAKSLSLGQKQKLDEQSAALGTAIDIANDVRKDLPTLNSLISAGKIKVSTNPGTGHLLISRLMSLTPEEERLAGNMQSLSEHINTLRGPLGATGFRGAEAWAALQAQRGNLLANPGITAQVLQNTIKSLNKIKASKDKYLNPQEAVDNKPPEKPVVKWGKDANGNPVRLSQ